MATPTQRIRSTAASFVSYDPERQVLGVTWNGGRTYYYRGVSQAVYEALLKAPSIGEFLNYNVRNSYPFS
jgi:hypothetical protein